MLPPGHVAVGYLVFSLIRRLVYDKRPSDLSTVWLVFGTQLPDVIDKPLAWRFGVLPSGRSLGHSLLFAVPIVLLVDRRLRRRGRPDASQGFVVGYLSHLFTDWLVAHPVYRDGPEWGSFLLWPILASPDYGPRPPLWPPAVYVDPVEFALGLAIVGLWLIDGAPGLAYVSAARDRFSRSTKKR